jgi:hypothetical protein
MAHHPECMLGVLESNPSHYFDKIPILSNPFLQTWINDHLIFELSTNVPSTTEILPHVANLHKITTIKDRCNAIKTAVLDFNTELKDCVEQVIIGKVEESEGINALILDSQIEALEKRFIHHLDQIRTGPLS